MEFSHLPLEIQLMIMRALDFKSLLNFSATSKAIHDIFLHEDKNLLKHALLDVEESGIPPTLNSTFPPDWELISFFPCYGCHALLLGCFFTGQDWYSPSTRTGPNAFRRRCLTCQTKGKYRFTRHSRLLDASQEYVYCGGCKLVMLNKPPLIDGNWQQSLVSYMIRSQVSARKDFRCVFCQAKARGEKWPAQEERIMAGNQMV